VNILFLQDNTVVLLINPLSIQHSFCWWRNKHTL